MKRYALLTVLLAGTCAATAAESATPASLLDARLDQRILDQLAAPITSRAALDSYLRQIPPGSPLMALSQRARTQFLDSLVFTDRGLASYGYLPLQQIDLADAYRILALFGVQRSLAVAPGMHAASAQGKLLEAALSPDPVMVDYPGYACVSKATCSSTYSSICIGGNC